MSVPWWFPGGLGCRNRLMSASLLGDIHRLRTRGAAVLRSGRMARLDDLRVVIALRTRIEAGVHDALERGDPVPFIEMLRADRACVPNASTLLYLDEDDAVAAAEGAGGELNALAWHGVSRWGLVRDALPRWIAQIATRRGEHLHRAEVARAVADLRREKGREYVNTALVDETGEWREELGKADLLWLLRRARRH